MLLRHSLVGLIVVLNLNVCGNAVSAWRPIYLQPVSSEVSCLLIGGQCGTNTGNSVPECATSTTTDGCTSVFAPAGGCGTAGRCAVPCTFQQNEFTGGGTYKKKYVTTACPTANRASCVPGYVSGCRCDSSATIARACAGNYDARVDCSGE